MAPHDASFIRALAEEYAHKYNPDHFAPFPYQNVADLHDDLSVFFANLEDNDVSGVTRWQVGDRVTVPFVNACGRCPRCLQGDHQVCDDQRQPGFTHWGSFAEYTVARADKLARKPANVTFQQAAVVPVSALT